MGTAITKPGYHRGYVPPNKGKVYPIEILTADEARAILLACRDTVYGIRNRALFTLLYRTGLRIGEALALWPKDFNGEVGSVAVLHGKGGRQRTVGIDAGGVEVVDEWIKLRNARDLPQEAPLFCTLRGTHVWPSTIQTTLHRIARVAGVEKRVHAHGFRHTFAYELAMEGIAMPIIQAQLGHTSLATTDRYLSHIAPRQVIEAIAKREWEP